MLVTDGNLHYDGDRMDSAQDSTIFSASYQMDTVITETKPAKLEKCVGVMMPVTEVLAQIGGKWTIHVIMALSQGPRRFSELLRSTEGISQKMLAATLRDLEKDGFVTRTVTPTIPLRVDYELTEMGRDLGVPLGAIGRWAQANRHRIEVARARFAEREAEQRAGPVTREVLSARRRGSVL
jgi:DNA-binding HxlR family transcriptional regulator